MDICKLKQENEYRQNSLFANIKKKKIDNYYLLFLKYITEIPIITPIRTKAALLPIRAALLIVFVGINTVQVEK